MPPLPPHPPLASLADPSPPSQPPLLGTDRSIDLDNAPINEGGEGAISITDDGGFIAGAVGGGVLLLLLLAATGRLLAAACGVLYHRRVLRARAAAALRASALRPPLGAKRRGISRKVSLARRKSISLKVFLDRLPGRGSSATVEEPRAPAVPPSRRLYTRRCKIRSTAMRRHRSPTILRAERFSCGRAGFSCGRAGFSCGRVWFSCGRAVAFSSPMPRAARKGAIWTATTCDWCSV